jgi:hypothetical protein
MNIENNFSTIKDENGIEWEVCNDEIEDKENYEYEELEIFKLKTNQFTFEALNKLMDNNIKTNIHFIYSKLTHNLAMDILSGMDIWNGKVNIEKLNAVIFLLFKPHGAGKKLNWKPTKFQLKEFSKLVFAPKSKFKIGMDSCLINHILQYSQPNELQRMSIDSCEGGRMSAYITPDMRMMPCSFSDKDKWAVPINNALDIKWAWDNSKPFTTFRNILTKNQCSCPLTL